MSLIQEALKRQQEETEGQTPQQPPSAPAPEAPAPPPPAPISPVVPIAEDAPAPPVPALEKKPIPPPAPVAAPVPAPEAARPTEAADAPDEEDTSTARKTSETKERPPKVLPTLVGVFLLIALLLVAIGWAVIYGLQFIGIQMPWQPAATTETTTVVDDATQPQETVAPEVTPATPEPPTEPTPASQEPPPATQEPPVETTATTTPAEPVEGTTPAPAAVSDAPPPAEPVAPRPPRVKWPSAKLSGIVGGGRSGAVMINGKIAGINETVDGIRIASIEATGAWLEFGGEKRFLKVGKTLE
jgi:hypothetical protein